MKKNRKKLAVLAAGEFREFENAVKTWFWLDEIDCDLFISTWSKTVEVNHPLGISIEEYVTKEKILKHIPNAMINIEKYETGTTLHSTLNSNKYIYHMRKLFNMVEMSDYDYDLIFLTRPDVAYKDNGGFSEYVKGINDDYIRASGPICFSPPPGTIYIQDTFFLGKKNIMRNIFLSLPYIDTSVRDIHYYLSKHFVYNDVYIVDIGGQYLDYFIMRSIHRKYLHLDFETQRKIGIHWWQVKNDGMKIDNNLLNL